VFDIVETLGTADDQEPILFQGAVQFIDHFCLCGVVKIDQHISAEDDVIFLCRYGIRHQVVALKRHHAFDFILYLDVTIPLAGPLFEIFFEHGGGQTLGPFCGEDAALPLAQNIR